MNIAQLRKIADREEIDYQFLCSKLSEYASPRDKISEWLKSGELIRIKKGLYIFGKTSALVPFSHEILANQIYGPSAISLHYALAYYGLIPERVTTITSITNKRNKSFSTPIGEFTYHYLNASKYAVGIQSAITTSHLTFLIASPEKALCDVIHLMERSLQWSTFDEVEHYLLDDLRLNHEGLLSFRVEHLEEINFMYRDLRLKKLIQWFKLRRPI